jgi:hypothetical protein
MLSEKLVFRMLLLCALVLGLGCGCCQRQLGSKQPVEMDMLSRGEMKCICGACTKKAPDCLDIPNPCKLQYRQCTHCYVSYAPDVPPGWYWCRDKFDFYPQKKCQNMYYGIISCENSSKPCGTRGMWYDKSTCDETQWEPNFTWAIPGGSTCTVERCPPEPEP